MLGRRRLVLDVRQLVAGEEPLQHTLAFVREHASHAIDLDRVDADADDHRVLPPVLLFRASSTTACRWAASSAWSTATQTRSAVSNVTRSCVDQARQRRRSVVAPTAASATWRRAVNASNSGSPASTGAAPRARRAGPGSRWRSGGDFVRVAGGGS